MAETIYALSREAQEVADLILDPDFDMTAEGQMDGVLSMLHNIDKRVEVAADHWAAIIQECLARAEMRKNEVARLEQRATTDANLAKRLKDGLKDLMNVSGNKRLETQRFKITVAKNGGKQPLEIFDEEEAKKKYPKHTITVDTELLRLAIEEGEEMEYACLKDRGTHLRIS